MCTMASMCRAGQEVGELAIGDQFQTFEELEQKLKTYECTKFVKYWRRDSRTIATARKRVSRPLSDRLKYYEVAYHCIHGGRKFTANGEGKRATM